MSEDTITVVLDFDGGLFADQRWQEWLTGRRADDTSRAYSSDLRQTFSDYARERGAAHWDDLTAHDIISYPAWLRLRNYKPATCARKLAALRVALRYGRVLGLVPSQLVEAADLTKGDYVDDISPRYPLDRGQVREMLATMDRETAKGIRDYAILTTLLYLGVRNEEAATLTLGHFHRAGDYLVVRVTGKGRRTRELPVRPLLSEAVRRYLAADQRDCDLFAVPSERAAEWLFPPIRNRSTEEGLCKHISTNGLRILVERAAARAGISCDVHTLRLTAATNAIEAGATLDQVQDLLGHQDIRTTRRYVKRHQSLANSAAHLINY